jgi:hypothetical protein
MPHQVLEEIPVKADPKAWVEVHAKQDMEESRDYEGYLKAKERFPKLSFDTYDKHSYLFDDERIRAPLPNREAVRKYFDNHNWSVYKSICEGSQSAHRKQRLHELLEEGSVDESAKHLVIYYIGNYLLSVSSDAARQAFSSVNLYEEAVKPLLAKYPGLVQKAVVRLTAALVDEISDELKGLDDDPYLLSSFYSCECSKLRGLIENPEFSRFLPADQLEAARRTLEEATKVYNDDPDFYDYLKAAYARLDTLGQY